MYILNDKLGARLGVGPRIDYKNLVLFAPFFHLDRTDQCFFLQELDINFINKKNNS
jgi:hypothetical protein